MGLVFWRPAQNMPAPTTQIKINTAMNRYGVIELPLPFLFQSVAFSANVDHGREIELMDTFSDVVFGMSVSFTIERNGICG